MKTIRAYLCLALLLPFAASAAQLCVAGTMNKGSVRIEIDSATGQATPDTCEVQAGTEVHWISGKGFEAKFTQDSPATSGEKTFPSHWVLIHHATKPFTAMDVPSQLKFPYDAHTEKASADPTIIVDPKPPTTRSSGSTGK